MRGENEGGKGFILAHPKKWIRGRYFGDIHTSKFASLLLRLQVEVEIVYTDHFWRQFERRKRASPVELTTELIEDAIKTPDLVMKDPRHPSREWRIKKIAGRCLKIVVENEGHRVTAITLMFDRTLRRKGLCK